MNGTFFKNPNINNDNEDQRKNEYSILNDNISKKVKIAIKKDNEEKIFSGILESYQDYTIILSDPSNGNWFLIPQKYLYYIEFEEKINFL